jgi:FkbM family methyltransferase
VPHGRHGAVAAFHYRNYRAAVNTLRLADRPVNALLRYIIQTPRFAYPWNPTIRTPIGRIQLTVPSPQDGPTLNEVFFRLDYRTKRPGRVVVDIGANIGISAAWFLSRRPDAVVYAYEPLENNVETLRQNLEQFTGRWHLSAVAVAPTAGRATFLADPSGRLSGLADYVQVYGNRTPLELECPSIAEVLAEVIAREGHIDLLKIDTEGSEEALVEAIPSDLALEIGEIVYEARAGGVRRIRVSG